jgi:CheY-like chemotaxis protein
LPTNGHVRSGRQPTDDSVKTEQPASLGSASGAWATSIDSMNLMLADLSQSLANARANNLLIADLTQSNATVRMSTITGKSVLIVDDHMRNIFALTSALERHQMHILHARSDQQAIALLRDTPDVDAVLMDIMMPDMDGFETMRQIRADQQFATLPIIAVTAKAMKADRDQCLEAGASDYISKPVDVTHLASLLRVWLNRH